MAEETQHDRKTERAKESHDRCSQSPGMCVLKNADLGTQVLLVVNSFKLHLTALKILKCFIPVKSPFQEKKPVPPTEKFPSLVLPRNMIMIMTTPHYLSSVCLQKFKMKENFKLLALKVVTVAYSDLTG